MTVFSMSKKTDDTVLKGTVICCGSEPFVFPVLETSDGKRFSFDVSKSTKEKLLKEQGRALVFYGQIKDSENPLEQQKDGEFVLFKYKKLD